MAAAFRALPPLELSEEKLKKPLQLSGGDLRHGELSNGMK